MSGQSTDGNDRESFRQLVDVIEDAGFEITHEKYKSDREDDEFKATFWIRSLQTDTDKLEDGDRP